MQSALQNNARFRMRFSRSDSDLMPCFLLELDMATRVLAVAAAVAAVALARKTLPMRVPATTAELLAMPPAALERLRAQERGDVLIVGGEEVDPAFKYPWQADIFYRNSGHFCGGSLINETWVLTAARTVVETTKEPKGVGGKG